MGEPVPKQIDNKYQPAYKKNELPGKNTVPRMLRIFSRFSHFHLSNKIIINKNSNPTPTAIIMPSLGMNDSSVFDAVQLTPLWA